MHKNKGDVKGFQVNFETFSSVSDLIKDSYAMYTTHLSGLDERILPTPRTNHIAGFANTAHSQTGKKI